MKKRNLFKSNLNKIARGGYKSKDHEIALHNIKLLYEARETIIRLFNYYSTISSEAKYKAIHEKWHS